MKKFIALYYANGGHSPAPDMTPEQKEEMMAPWGAWQAKYGERVVDLGAPFMPATASSNGDSWATSSNKVSGFSLVEADSMEAAQEMFKGHPIYNYTDHSIEISEFASM